MLEPKKKLVFLLTLIQGMIVEPVQAEGGDHHGSAAWFQGLQVILS